MAKKTRLDLTYIVIALVLAAAILGSTFMYINFQKRRLKESQRVERIETSLKNQKDCVRAGTNYLDEIKKKEEPYSFVISDGYHFNELDNTCYIAIRRNIKSETPQPEGAKFAPFVLSIVDVYSNIRTIEVYSNIFDGISDEDKQEWKDAAFKYMNIEY